MLLLILLTVTPSDVFAEGPGPSDESSYGSERRLGGVWGWVAKMLPMKSSPSGCRQSVHDPHKSTHAAQVGLNRVNFEVRATCNNPVPEMTHTAVLEKNSGSSWGSTGTIGVFREVWVQRGSAYGNDVCEKAKYQGKGSGFILDVDEDMYVAMTRSRIVYNPCGL